MDKFLKLARENWIITVLMIVIVFLIFVQIEPNENKIKDNAFLDISTIEQEVEQDSRQAFEKTPSMIVVDIKGAVVNPGVIEVEEGTRVSEVIKMVGGFLDNADQLKVNLAAILEDEMVLYVPYVGEEESEFLTDYNEKDKKININKATLEDLQQLPGIGPSKAAAIIAYREENGRFKTIEELMLVSGIGQKSFEKIKNLVSH
ncbi:helix-hairpin-helix domain-containing protein [Bacillus timonensis]|nr:helix-hairpin-helix domain-containing protein [Bacillus timonensis]